MDVLMANWPLALIALALALVLLYFLLRPRQRVTLTDSAPVRPHMTMTKNGEGKGIGDEAAAAVADVAGSIISARVHDALPGASGPPDDLVQLKGIGPKLAGFVAHPVEVHIDQIAKLTPAQVDDLDDALGAFRGRLARDQVIDQADYLARGDIDGFEQRYGKL